MKTHATVRPSIFVEESIKSPTFQAYQILHWSFFLAPLLAGLDKFFNRMVDWTMYLWSPLGKIFGSAGNFMRIVGAIEIIAAFLVLLKPKFGAPVVAVWLLGIIINLLLVGSYFDIALRDFGLFLAALALFRLATQFDHRQTVSTVS